MKTNSKLLTVLFMLVCVITPLLIYGLTGSFIESSASRNGRGIDGFGAAIVTAFLAEIIRLAGLAGYAVMACFCIRRIINFKMPIWSVIIPLIPAIIIIGSIITDQTRAYVERKTYDADAYVQLITEHKKVFIRNTDKGNSAVNTDYIWSFMLGTWQPAAYNSLDEQKQKNIFNEAVPILMQDIENETLCDESGYNKDIGKPIYSEVTIESWNWNPETGTLSVIYNNGENDVFIKQWK